MLTTQDVRDLLAIIDNASFQGSQIERVMELKRKLFMIGQQGGNKGGSEEGSKND